MSGRGGGGDSGDDSTPLFFLLALLLCVVIPWTLSVLWWFIFPGAKEVRRSFPDVTERGENVRHCQTQAMREKREKRIRTLRSWRHGCSRGFSIRLAVLAMLLCWLIYIVVQLRAVMETSSLYKNFDPYELLDISSSATRSEIKKGYHKKSLKYHPDRNPDPKAAEHFILVKKAYDSLMDPVAKRNYQLYGNPDGPTRVELSVALPKIGKERQGLVLVLFMVVFILGVPLSVLFCCMGGGADKCANGVLRETIEALAEGVKPATNVRAAQALLLAAQENAGSALPPSQAAELATIFAELGGKAPKGQTEAPVAEMLFLVHTQRAHAKLTGSMMQALEELLPKWRLIALAMAELATKRGYPSAFEAALNLNRCILQAIEVDSCTTSGLLLQVPHFDDEVVKAWKKNAKKNAELTSIGDMDPDDRRKSLAASGLSEQQILDVEEYARCLPRVQIAEVKVFVEGEDNICMGDIATLQVTVVCTNLEEGDASGAVHAPFFTNAAVPQAWWLTYSQPGRNSRMAFKRVMNNSREVTLSVKFVVQSVGPSRGKLVVSCESYLGLDLDQVVVFRAEKANKPIDRHESEEALNEDLVVEGED